MSALEVLQTCPLQRRSFLSSLGVDDDNFYSVIKHTVINEGAAAFVMSLSCWKSLGSPKLSQSTTMLTAFDGRSFRPHKIIPSLKFLLVGKIVAIEVKVVDVPLDYNLLLGHNWMYSMQAVVRGVANSVMEKNSYGLGCTTIDRVTVEINPFPICKRNTTSNTKGSRNIPYSNGCSRSPLSFFQSYLC